MTDPRGFIGQEVEVTFRYGGKHIGVLRRSGLFFCFKGNTFAHLKWSFLGCLALWRSNNPLDHEKAERYFGPEYLSGHSIVNIQPVGPKLKDYEKLEQQVQELKAEVNRLKAKDKGETYLPDNFNRDLCLRYLDTRNVTFLANSFSMGDTPQGGSHWLDIVCDTKPLTVEDENQLRKWIIASYQQDFEE